MNKGPFFMAVACLLLLRQVVWSQDRIPKFGERSDSVQYQSTWAALQGISRTVTRDSVTYRTMDSLYSVLAAIRERGQIGWIYRYLPNATFVSLDSVIAGKIAANEPERISIHNPEWKKIPKQLYACRSVKHIELVNTIIRRLPAKLRRLTKLRSVAVYNNRPTRRLLLGKNTGVTQLTIRGDRPEALPKSYRHWSGLDTLDLSKNLLTTFPIISGMPHLVKLVLTENLLTLDDLDGHGSRYLRVLLLGTNKITQVPPAIANFPSLTKLNFQVNSIVSVSPGLGKLRALEELSFYKNQLDSIPDCLYELNDLKRIDLYYNKISELSERVANWKNLEVLYLSHNHLTRVPEAIGGLNHLKELYLHHNLIADLPESISELTALEVLRLNDNLLPTVPSSVLTLRSLSNLDLANNQLTSLPEELSNLHGLKILALGGNPYTDLPATYETVERLRSTGINVHLDFSRVEHAKGD